MTIPFARVNQAPLDFEVTLADEGCDLKLSGLLTRQKGGLVQFKGSLSGTLTLECDRCAADWVAAIDEPVELLLCDDLYEKAQEEQLLWPVIEMPDGRIDADALIFSEKEAYRCGYHHCPDCAGKNMFEINEGE